MQNLIAALILFVSSFFGTQPVSKPVTLFPISNFSDRITFRTFGQLVSSGEEKKVVCGKAFSGYHTGIDLETTPTEQNSDVPVYSISAGKVVLADFVSGYGGLIVILDSNRTIYYGHVNIASSTVKKGDTVILGEKLAVLGKGCSSETDGERKHLHFAIHQGQIIDVRGYVPTKSELSVWLDPNTNL